ncbi:MAG: hypothetical protein GX640_23125 [Fibrobacter sp.]|nr:hypothetical protein [Fibrobacter sp.]
MSAFFRVSMIIFTCFSSVAAVRYPGYYINKSNEKVVVDFEVRSSYINGDINYM